MGGKGEEKVRTMWVGDLHVCREVRRMEVMEHTCTHTCQKHTQTLNLITQHTPFSKLNKPICIYIHVHLKNPYVMYSTPTCTIQYSPDTTSRPILSGEPFYLNANICRTCDLYSIRMCSDGLREGV